MSLCTNFNSEDHGLRVTVLPKDVFEVHGGFLSRVMRILVQFSRIRPRLDPFHGGKILGLIRVLHQFYRWK